MSGPGSASNAVDPFVEARLIAIDLSDLRLPADLSRPDVVATATAHVYERFVAYADDGWEWVTFPGARDFEGWQISEHGRSITGVHLLCRRAAPVETTRAAHGVSPYRTRQLTGFAWTAEPGSKRWRSTV